MGWASRAKKIQTAGPPTAPALHPPTSFPVGPASRDPERQLHCLMDCLRPLLASTGWEALSPQGKLRKFRAACRSCPDLKDLWPTMDKAPQNWFEAMDYCTRAIAREASS